MGRFRVVAGCLTSLVLFAATGCNSSEEIVEAATPFPPGFSVAVAPALNFSGQLELDPVRVADLFASELGQHEGLTIVPVSRVVALLAREGRIQIRSPEHALATAEKLGCDAMCVIGVTEYQPYSPSVVGLAVQLYVRPGRLDEPVSLAAGEKGGGGVPAAQVQRVYQAASEGVAEGVRKYARSRDADKSPYGWRRYMVSQELFLRYCCHDAGEQLARQMLPDEVMAEAGQPE